MTYEEAIHDMEMLKNIWIDIGQPTEERDLAIQAMKKQVPTVTNGDKLRNMTDEELYRMVTAAGFSRCRFCDLMDTQGNKCFRNGAEQCRSNILAWLKQEARE
jgi:hypothetical protein